MRWSYRYGAMKIFSYFPPKKRHLKQTLPRVASGKKQEKWLNGHSASDQAAIITWSIKAKLKLKTGSSEISVCVRKSWLMMVMMQICGF